MTTFTIAVVGAGFSGSMVSLHLSRLCPPHVRVVLIERADAPGPGMAYGTDNPSHVLNVPAGRMSAFQNRPTDFLEWLARRFAAEGKPAPSAGSFVARRLFGEYVRGLLDEAVAGQSSASQLSMMRADVVALDGSGPALRLHTGSGAIVEADLAVLAMGNFPPAPPPLADGSFDDTAYYVADPWGKAELPAMDAEAPVLLIGTGLTMVDVVIALLDRGHRGPIHAISRRGLLPRRHASGGGAAEDFSPLPTEPRALMRHIRRHATRTMAAGGSWQAVIDGLRPFTQDIWQAMAVPDRARFLRHARVWWDIFRHRMPGDVADRIEAARAAGQLRLHRGRIESYQIEADGGPPVSVTYLTRGTGRRNVLRAARVVNCTGVFADFTRVPDPLVRHLLDAGAARADPLRLGLDVTRSGALLDDTGAMSPRVFAVGPITKGVFWEMTAVPDIRRQCEALAGHLAGLVKPPRPPDVKLP